MVNIHTSTPPAVVCLRGDERGTYLGAYEVFRA